MFINNLRDYSKILSASSIGALFECYDFMICAFLAPVLIKHFYSSNVFWGVFSIFTIAFFSRPLGGMFWGYLGDIYGRKKIFSFSMVMLSIPTLLIAFFPLSLFTQLTSGILFAVLRFSQGFFVGGEFPGGVVFVAESSKPDSRGFNVALFMSALTGGTLLASVTALLLNLMLSKDQIESFGWRLPFLLGIALVFIAIYIRRHVHETALFQNIQLKKEIDSNPIVALFKYNHHAILRGLLIVFCSASGLTTLYVFFPQMMNKSFLNSEQILFITTIGTIILCLAMPIMGYFSDKVNKVKLCLCGLILLIFGWSIIIYATKSSSYSGVVLGMMIASLSFAMINGCYCSILVELFPTNIRYSGVAFCYSFGYSLCGGILPLFYNLSNTILLRVSQPIIVFTVLLLVVYRLHAAFINYNGQNLQD